LVWELTLERHRQRGYRNVSPPATLPDRDRDQRRLTPLPPLHRIPICFLSHFASQRYELDGSLGAHDILSLLEPNQPR
jgi:hypothetical protein